MLSGLSGFEILSGIGVKLIMLTLPCWENGIALHNAIVCCYHSSLAFLHRADIIYAQIVKCSQVHAIV